MTFVRWCSCQQLAIVSSFAIGLVGGIHHRVERREAMLSVAARHAIRRVSQAPVLRTAGFRSMCPTRAVVLPTLRSAPTLQQKRMKSGNTGDSILPPSLSSSVLTWTSLRYCDDHGFVSTTTNHRADLFSSFRRR